MLTTFNRTQNKVNAYLNQPLVAVSNGKSPIPRELPVS